MSPRNKLKEGARKKRGPKAMRAQIRKKKIKYICESEIITKFGEFPHKKFWDHFVYSKCIDLYTQQIENTCHFTSIYIYMWCVCSFIYISVH